MVRQLSSKHSAIPADTANLLKWNPRFAASIEKLQSHGASSFFCERENGPTRNQQLAINGVTLESPCCCPSRAAQVLRFLEHFKVTDDDIAYLREQLPDCEEGFWDWFQNELDVGQLRVCARPAGGVEMYRSSFL